MAQNFCSKLFNKVHYPICFGSQGRKQQRLRHKFGEFQHANTCWGNWFEQSVSSICITSKREIPTTNV